MKKPPLGVALLMSYYAMTAGSKESRTHWSAPCFLGARLCHADYQAGHRSSAGLLVRFVTPVPSAFIT